MNQKTIEERKALKEVRRTKREMEIKTLKDNATKFIDSFNRTGEKYVSIRIRDGYIGKYNDGYIQTVRSRPRGTLIAIKGENGKVYIGASYLNPYDKDTPIIGMANALSAALKFRENNIAAINNNNLEDNCAKPKDKDLFKFFAIRSLCYFYPDLYSHSRGTDKIEYPNYEEIHRNIKFLSEM